MNDPKSLLNLTIDLIKKAIGWPLTWSLFWLGHWCSKGACKIGYDHEHETEMLDLRFDFLFKAYQKLMSGSLIVQDWAGLTTPWEQVDEHSEEFE